jgi:hypothetical protein
VLFPTRLIRVPVGRVTAEHCNASWRGSGVNKEEEEEEESRQCLSRHRVYIF